MKVLGRFGTSRGRESSGRRGAFRPGQTPTERLEVRAVPATVVVQTAGDAVGQIIANGDGTFSAPTLRSAVNFTNIRPGADTIVFAPSLAGGRIFLTANDDVYPFAFGGPTALVVTETVSIIGPASGGLTLDGFLSRRHFGVAEFVTLNLANLTLADGKAVGGKGGAGAFGGGGGAGLGGSVYGTLATLNFTNCTFEGNNAIGGAGGDGVSNGDDPTGQSGGGGGASAAFPGGNGGSDGLGNGGGGGGGGTEGPGGDGNKNQGGVGGVNIRFVPTPAGANGADGAGGGGGSRPFSGAKNGGDSKGVNIGTFGGGGGGGASSDGTDGKGAGGGGDFGAGGGGAGVSGNSKGGAGGFGGGAGGSDTGSPAISLYGGGNGGYFTATAEVAGGGGGAGLGGAIFLNSGTLTLTNCTFYENVARGGNGGNGGGFGGTADGSQGQGVGSAVFAFGGVTVVANNCTFDDNVGNGQIVIVKRLGSSRGASLTLRNTVVAGSGSPGPDVVVRGLKGARIPKVYGFNNFLGKVGKIPRRLVVGRGNPDLGTLADNGGPTRTLLPKPGSPLINAGRRPRKGLPATDQRGMPRVIGGRVDIGAVEVS